MADEALFGVNLGELRNIRPGQMAVRFAFGAATSVVAGLAGAFLGPLPGGMLLAFPAILPAGLTLIERDQGNEAAVREVGGAALGGVGLTAFAAVAFVAFGAGLPRAVSLGAALVAWTVVGIGLYVLRAKHVLAVSRWIPGRRPAARR